MIRDLRFVVCDLQLGKHLLRMIIAALVLGLVTVSLPVSANADTMLRWKFAAGEQLQVAVDQHTATETTGAGQPTGIDIALQLHMSWTIDSVDPSGAAQITQRFERFAVTMKSGNAEPIAYASDAANKPSGAAAEIAAAVAPVIGADFTVTMTDRGAIRAVKLSDAAAKAFASVGSPALKQLFSAEGITQLLGQAAVEFPEEAVAKDSNWVATLTTPSPLGTLTQSRTYTLAGPEVVDGKTLERIEVAGTLEIKRSGTNASELRVLDQSLAGAMLFDLEAGRLLKSESTQKLTTERPYRELKIKVETTASTTTTISSLNP